MPKSSHDEWKTTTIPRDISDELDVFINTDFAKSKGFTSKAQIVTAAVRDLLDKYQNEMLFLQKESMTNLNYDLITINLIYKEDFQSFFKIWIPVIKAIIPTKEMKDLSNMLDAISLQLANELFPELIKKVGKKESVYGYVNYEDIMKYSIKKYLQENNKMPDIFIEICTPYLDKINQLSKIKLTPEKLYKLMSFFSLPVKERVKQNLHTIFKSVNKKSVSNSS